jgi:coenzyme F420-reducing hydrogenase gamma subunit
MEQPSHNAGGDWHERLVVGWFSFTCCEDSTILLTELLNDHLEEWLRVVEFRHMKTLKTNNSIEGLDVAFVEGAISSDSQAVEVPRYVRTPRTSSP